MKTIKLSQASLTLAEYAADLGADVVVVTDRNKPVAAVVPLRGVDRESLALSTHPEFLRVIERSRAAVRAGRTVSLESMKREFLASKSPNTALQPTSHARRAQRKLRSRARAARG